MRRKYLWRVSGFVLLASTLTVAQAAQDPAALQVLQTAVAALGGANIGQIQDSIAQGSIQMPAGSTGATPTFLWETSGSEFRYESTGADGHRIFVSGHGSPADWQDGQLVPVSRHLVRSSMPFHLPGLILLKAINQSNLTISMVGTQLVGGISVTQIHLSDDSTRISQAVTGQEWFFNASTGLPLRVKYRRPLLLNPQQCIVVTLDLSHYQQVNGLLIPYVIQVGFDGNVLTDTISTIAFNTGLPASDFDPPMGGN